MQVDSLKLTAREIGGLLERELTLPAGEAGLEPADAELHIQFQVVPCGGEAVVSGRVQAAFQAECAVCLVPMESEIEETFSCSHPLSSDAEIDLLPDVRDAFMAGTPIRLKCSPRCKGLCAKCGKNLNESPCSCPAPEVVQPLKVALNEALERGSSTRPG